MWLMLLTSYHHCTVCDGPRALATSGKTFRSGVVSSLIQARLRIITQIFAFTVTFILLVLKGSFEAKFKLDMLATF